MSLLPEIQTQITGGEASNFAGADMPPALHESLNLLERAKRAALYTMFQAAPKFMATLREEHEVLEDSANHIIALNAKDRAVARALDALCSDGAQSRAHELLAQLTVLRLLPEVRAAIEGALMMAFEGEERRAELAAVRRYIGDPETSVVPLQRELATLIAEHGGYPLE